MKIFKIITSTFAVITIIQKADAIKIIFDNNILIELHDSFLHIKQQYKISNDFDTWQFISNNLDTLAQNQYITDEQKLWMQLLSNPNPVDVNNNPITFEAHQVTCAEFLYFGSAKPGKSPPMKFNQLNVRQQHISKLRKDFLSSAPAKITINDTPISQTKLPYAGYGVNKRITTKWVQGTDGDVRDVINDIMHANRIEKQKSFLELTKQIDKLQFIITIHKDLRIHSSINKLLPQLDYIKHNLNTPDTVGKSYNKYLAKVLDPQNSDIDLFDLMLLKASAKEGTFLLTKNTKILSDLAIFPLRYWAKTPKLLFPQYIQSKADFINAYWSLEVDNVQQRFNDELKIVNEKLDTLSIPQAEKQLVKNQIKAAFEGDVVNENFLPNLKALQIITTTPQKEKVQIDLDKIRKTNILHSEDVKAAIDKIIMYQEDYSGKLKETDFTNAKTINELTSVKLVVVKYNSGSNFYNFNQAVNQLTQSIFCPTAQGPRLKRDACEVAKKHTKKINSENIHKYYPAPLEVDESNTKSKSTKVSHKSINTKLKKNSGLVELLQDIDNPKSLTTRVLVEISPEVATKLAKFGIKSIPKDAIPKLIKLVEQGLYKIGIANQKSAKLISNQIANTIKAELKAAPGAVGGIVQIGMNVYYISDDNLDIVQKLLIGGDIGVGVINLGSTAIGKAIPGLGPVGLIIGGAQALYAEHKEIIGIAEQIKLTNGEFFRSLLDHFVPLSFKTVGVDLLDKEQLQENIKATVFFKNYALKVTSNLIHEDVAIVIFSVPKVTMHLEMQYNCYKPSKGQKSPMKCYPEVSKSSISYTNHVSRSKKIELKSDEIRSENTGRLFQESTGFQIICAPQDEDINVSEVVVSHKSTYADEKKSIMVKNTNTIYSLLNDQPSSSQKSFLNECNDKVALLITKTLTGRLLPLAEQTVLIHGPLDAIHDLSSLAVAKVIIASWTLDSNLNNLKLHPATSLLINIASGTPFDQTLPANTTIFSGTGNKLNLSGKAPKAIYGNSLVINTQQNHSFLIVVNASLNDFIGSKIADSKFIIDLGPKGPIILNNTNTTIPHTVHFSESSFFITIIPQANGTKAMHIIESTSQDSKVVEQEMKNLYDNPPNYEYLFQYKNNNQKIIATNIQNFTVPINTNEDYILFNIMKVIVPQPSSVKIYTKSSVIVDIKELGKLEAIAHQCVAQGNSYTTYQSNGQASGHIQILGNNSENIKNSKILTQSRNYINKKCDGGVENWVATNEVNVKPNSNNTITNEDIDARNSILLFSGQNFTDVGIAKQGDNLVILMPKFNAIAFIEGGMQRVTNELHGKGNPCGKASENLQHGNVGAPLLDELMKCIGGSYSFPLRLEFNDQTINATHLFDTPTTAAFETQVNLGILELIPIIPLKQGEHVEINLKKIKMVTIIYEASCATQDISLKKEELHSTTLRFDAETGHVTTLKVDNLSSKSTVIVTCQDSEVMIFRIAQGHDTVGEIKNNKIANQLNKLNKTEAYIVNDIQVLLQEEFANDNCDLSTNAYPSQYFYQNIMSPNAIDAFFSILQAAAINGALAVKIVRCYSVSAESTTYIIKSIGTTSTIPATRPINQLLKDNLYNVIKNKMQNFLQESEDNSRVKREAIDKNQAVSDLNHIEDLSVPSSASSVHDASFIGFMEKQFSQGINSLTAMLSSLANGLLQAHQNSEYNSHVSNGNYSNHTTITFSVGEENIGLEQGLENDYTTSPIFGKDVVPVVALKNNNRSFSQEWSRRDNNGDTYTIIKSCSQELGNLICQRKLVFENDKVIIIRKEGVVTIDHTTKSFKEDMLISKDAPDFSQFYHVYSNVLTVEKLLNVHQMVSNFLPNCKNKSLKIVDEILLTGCMIVAAYYIPFTENVTVLNTLHLVPTMKNTLQNLYQSFSDDGSVNTKALAVGSAAFTALALFGAPEMALPSIVFSIFYKVKNLIKLEKIAEEAKQESDEVVEAQNNLGAAACITVGAIGLTARLDLASGISSIPILGDGLDKASILYSLKLLLDWSKSCCQITKTDLSPYQEQFGTLWSQESLLGWGIEIENYL